MVSELVLTDIRDQHAQLERERDLQGRAGRPVDDTEGVPAVLERRAPGFTGRV
ncbi:MULTISPECIES: hypothetical protein [unclassified Bradyrhizobium]